MTAGHCLNDKHVLSHFSLLALAMRAAWLVQEMQEQGVLFFFFLLFWGGTGEVRSFRKCNHQSVGTITGFWSKSSFSGDLPIVNASLSSASGNAVTFLQITFIN